MFFTRQHTTAGQQTNFVRSQSFSALGPASANNWFPISICLGSAGARSRQYGLPGLEVFGCWDGSKPSDSVPAQIFFSMKNARKATGITVSDQFGPQTPATPDDKALFENQIFSQKPTPRQPESSDVESLRTLLKAKLSHEKASPALLQRIRSQMQEPKE